jgi:hypothetical protein
MIASVDKVRVVGYTLTSSAMIKQFFRNTDTLSETTRVLFTITDMICHRYSRSCNLEEVEIPW